MNTPLCHISVIVITLNEEENIAQCLQSVSWADEIILVDAQSTDRTAEVARQFTNHIFVRPWDGYSAAKAFAMAQASYSWILWLDADERVPLELAEEIQSVVRDHSSQYQGYAVARRAYFLDKWIKHCGWYPGYVVRLFKKDAVHFSTVNVHESVEVVGPTGRLQHDLLHYTDKNLYHYLSKYNRYTSLASIDLKKRGKHVSLYDLVIRPFFLFCKMYIFRLGFLDGRHGLILSLLSASYVFTKYSKTWERWYVDDKQE